MGRKKRDNESKRKLGVERIFIDNDLTWKERKGMEKKDDGQRFEERERM